MRITNNFKIDSKVKPESNELIQKSSESIFEQEYRSVFKARGLPWCFPLKLRSNQETQLRERNLKSIES